MSAYKKQKYVMLSYNHLDQTIANNFKTLLENNSIPCWMAPASIEYGSNYMDDIAGAIKNAAAVIVLISKNSQASEWVKREVQGAIDYGVMILPVFIEDCKLVFPFDFYIARNQTLDSLSFDSLLKNSDVAISSFIARLLSLIGVESKKIKVDKSAIFFDHSKFLNDINLLFDSLISIMVKDGLERNNYGKYSILHEISSIENFITSSSFNNINIVWGEDPTHIKMNIFYLTSNQCANNVSLAAKTAYTIIKHLVHNKKSLAPDHDKSLVEMIKSTFLDKANKNDLFNIFYKQYIKAYDPDKNENLTLRKFKHLKEKVKDDPRIDIFIAVLTNSIEDLEVAINDAKRKFGPSFNPNSFTDKMLFLEYAHLLEDFDE
ncbi:MAG: toll/interleukin-1 receptor domain-containing protein [Clostridia bacterium]|nr:toll/interleukin-1 receptor domain-containing protein [Clostridia bacterium]